MVDVPGATVVSGPAACNCNERATSCRAVVDSSGCRADKSGADAIYPHSALETAKVAGVGVVVHGPSHASRIAAGSLVAEH